MRKIVVRDIGGRKCTKEVEQIAQNLGKRLGKVANLLCCGGLGGIIAAVCKGFKAENGVTIGIIPGYDKKEANKYVVIVIPSGLGLARNVLVVKSADVVIALPGEAGTLSDIASPRPTREPPPSSSTGRHSSCSSPRCCRRSPPTRG